MSAHSLKKQYFDKRDDSDKLKFDEELSEKGLLEM